MTHASLFSGIGGFDLAAEWAGWRNVFNCEIDPFCRRVLKHHFPNTVQYEDIAKSDFSEWDGRIDVLTGGFPCQPFSVAGKRRGTEDDRYLWPAMLSAVRAVRPRWVVAENVHGIISQTGGLVFEQVFADLEAEGYEVGAYVLPACGVGAPHRRYRVWFVAHRSDTRAETLREGEDCVHAVGPAADTDGDRCRKRPSKQKLLFRGKRTADVGDGGTYGLTSDTDGERCYEQFLSEESGEPEAEFGDGYYAAIPDWSGFPTESPVRFRYDGISDNVVRYIKAEVYDAIKEHIRREDLPRVWENFQKKEIREQIGRLYEIPEPDLLLEVLQRASKDERHEQRQNGISQFGEETSERVLRYLRNHGTFTSSPLGQKYKEQFSRQFGDFMPELSHEIALATKKIIEECESTACHVNRESIKACGNAIVPQVAYMIFKTINEYERSSDKHRAVALAAEAGRACRKGKYDVGA